jgi:ATP-dependent Zn protease
MLIKNLKKYWWAPAAVAVIVLPMFYLYLAEPAHDISRDPNAPAAKAQVYTHKPDVVNSWTVELPSGKKLTGSETTHEVANQNLLETSGLKAVIDGIGSTVWNILIPAIIVYLLFLSVTGRLRNPFGGGGQPTSGFTGIPGTTSTDNSGIPGAPAGADLSFLTITWPEDNHARLDGSVILDKNLKKKLLRSVRDMKAKKEAYDAAKVEAVEEEKAWLKKVNKGGISGWLDGPQNKDPKVDMTKVKVKKLAPGLYGYKVPQGHLFAGGPGVGKTLAAVSMAGSAGVPLISITGTLENTLIGGGAQRVDIVMAIAMAIGPCYIFVDEAEQAAKQRNDGSFKQQGATSDGTTGKWLGAIDGVQNKIGGDGEFMTPADMIGFLFATNYADALDEAVKRPGRLVMVNFPKPTVKLLQRLLKLYMGKKAVPLADDIDHEYLAAATMLSDKSGADIADIANAFAGVALDESERLERRLRKAGKSVEEIASAKADLRFGQMHFLKAVIQHLMGDEIVDYTDDFVTAFGTTHHELFHGLVGAVVEYLKMNDYRMRLLCVQRRQKSLGVCFRSPANGESSGVSNLDVLAHVSVAYGGGAAQLVVNDDTERFGPNIDFYRDTGAHQDLAQAANMLKDLIAQHYGDLDIGPISKGHGHSTWATEMGDELVNDVDKAITENQRMAYAFAWKIATILLQSPIIWKMMDEVLNSEDRIMVEERFYDYFNNYILRDGELRRQLDELPAFYLDLAKNDKGHNWKPVVQTPAARAFIRAQTEELEAKYNAYQAHLKAKVEAEAEGEDDI